MIERLLVLCVGASALLLSPHIYAGLVINPIYDPSITSDPNSATIQDTINAAIQQYETQFSDPITVTIQFSQVASGLGQSSTYVGTVGYLTFLSALSADAKTTNDVIALAHLPAGVVNPVNGNSSVRLTSANFRALGFNASPPPGQPDSFIGLNFSIINLTRTNIDPNKYDLMAVVQHEIDEALSMGSVLNGLANGAPSPTGAVSVTDLYRYAPNGTRSFDTLTDTQAYFSIDGTNDLVRFNQTQGGDFSDWYSITAHTPRVQDAFGTPGATPNLDLELIALDVSGYNLVSAEPVPKIVTTTRSGNTVTLTWTSQANLSFQLQYKTNVTQAGWLDLGSAVTANGATASTSNTISATQRYYRIALLIASPTIVPQAVSKQPALSIITNYFRPSGRF